MKIVNKKKCIIRIIELILIILLIIFMPKVIVFATYIRGYKAIGGEYLLPILNLVIIMVLEDIL